MAKRVAFTDQAKADLRAIDQKTGLQILKTLARFAQSVASAPRLYSNVTRP